jgi:DNA polymerase III alpha subunit (gram-positive type)
MISTLVIQSTLIPAIITELTGIHDEDLSAFPTFQTVGGDFVKFVLENKKLWEETHFLSCNSVVFVAHKGTSFDVPFLFQHMKRYNVEEFDRLRDISFVLDTLQLARLMITRHKLPIPDNYKLSSLYYYVTTQTLEGAHRAHVDVSATVEIFRHPVFYDHRCDCIHKVNLDGQVIANAAERTITIRYVRS